MTGELLEYAVLLSVKEKDSEAFERNFAQLKSFYHECVLCERTFGLTYSAPAIGKWLPATGKACC